MQNLHLAELERGGPCSFRTWMVLAQGSESIPKRYTYSGALTPHVPLAASASQPLLHSCPQRDSTLSHTQDLSGLPLLESTLDHFWSITGPNTGTIIFYHKRATDQAL